MTRSLVIPITVGLTKVLQNMEDNLMPAVDRVRQDIIGGIGNRFRHLSYSRTFTNCMFLDPRFKLCFEDQATAEETKRRITALVVQEQNKNAALINTNANIVSENNIPKSIWQDYHQKMQNIQPDGTAQSRAIVEVQRYLDEKILGRYRGNRNRWNRFGNLPVPTHPYKGYPVAHVTSGFPPRKKRRRVKDNLMSFIS